VLCSRTWYTFAWVEASRGFRGPLSSLAPFGCPVRFFPLCVAISRAPGGSAGERGRKRRVSRERLFRWRQKGNVFAFFAEVGQGDRVAASQSAWSVAADVSRSFNFRVGLRSRTWYRRLRPRVFVGHGFLVCPLRLACSVASCACPFRLFLRAWSPRALVAVPASEAASGARQ